jgi:hypothetical protein
MYSLVRSGARPGGEREAAPPRNSARPPRFLPSARSAAQREGSHDRLFQRAQPARVAADRELRCGCPCRPDTGRRCPVAGRLRVPGGWSLGELSAVPECFRSFAALAPVSHGSARDYQISRCDPG